VRFGSGTMGLCRGFVRFRRLVVRVFHVVFSGWPTNLGWRKSAVNSVRRECQWCS
jgi:hypothetical protein